MHGGEHAAPGEEGAEDREREGHDDQREVPDLQHPPALLDLDRVQERGRGQPGQEGRVLDGIPRPVAAPAEHVVRPPAAEEVAEGEEEPAAERPLPRRRGPAGVEAARDERGHREGVGDRERDEAGVEQRRVGEHVGVLEERVEPAPVGRHRPDALEGVAGPDEDDQEERGDGREDAEDPRHQLRVAPAVLPGDEAGEAHEHPLPEQQRSLERRPEPGDPVVERGAERAVVGHVLEAEVAGHEGVDQEPARGRHEDHLPGEHGAPEAYRPASGEERREQARDGQREGQPEARRAEGRGHGVVLLTAPSRSGCR